MLEIRLLGEQRVVEDDQIVTAAQSPRVIGLLAQLVLHAGEDLPRAGLAGLFWPESSGEQSLTNLRRELHQLRKALPAADGCLVTDARSMRWRADAKASCDVADYQQWAARARSARANHDLVGFREAASRAVAQYGGDFMPARYDDWVLAEREQLKRQCLDLLTGLVEVTRDSDVGAATEYARRRVDLEPLEEVGYRDLMELQATAGDRAAALRSYHRCASVLERELGVAPDPATTVLYERLVAGEARRGATPPAPAVSSERRTGFPLVGRTQTMAVLADRWAAACRGQVGLHVLSGESGVGKSRVMDELALTVQREGAIVAQARCFAGRARLALAPVAEWLATPGLRAQHGDLDPVWAAEVDRLVPAPGASPTRPEPMVDAWQRHRFLEGLARAVLASDRPTLLILDDLQWCDGDTLVWIQLLLRLAANQRLLVLSAVRTRDFDDHSELGEWLTALRHDELLTSTDLAPLDLDATRELAELLGAQNVEAEAIHAATAGYPLFVIESARAGTSPPRTEFVGRLPRVNEVLTGRLSQLGADAQEIAKLASVVGRDFSLELLSDASDLNADGVVSAVDELWRRRIVTQHSRSTYDFAHDLLREAAYGQITPPLRALLHRRVAQSLELIHAGDLRSVAAAIADHYEQAGLTSRSVAFHVQAAEAATDLFANDDAIRHYQVAAELIRTLPPSPARDREELAIYQAMSAPLNARFGYASKRVEDAVRRSDELADRLGDGRLHLMALVGLFSVLFVQGHTRQSYEVGLRALELSRDHPEVVGQAHFAVAGPATSLAHLGEALEHFAVVPDLTMDLPPALVGTRTEVHSQAWAAHALWLVGRRDEATRTGDWAIARAREVDHPYSLAVAMAYATTTAQFNQERDTVRSLARQTQELCARYSFAYYGDWAAILAGWAEGGTDGIESIYRGIRGLDRQGALARRPYFLSLLAASLVGTGRTVDAAAVLDSACSTATTHEDVWWLPEVLRQKALLGPAGRRSQTLKDAVRMARQQGSVVLAERAAAELAEVSGQD